MFLLISIKCGFILGSVSPASLPATVGNLPPVAASFPEKTLTTRVAEPGNVKAQSIYLAALKYLIERKKDYPAMVKRGHMEGTVLIRCVLERNGTIKETGIVASSGYTLLNNAALRSIRSVGQFPEVPFDCK
jgi:protein TonB